MKQLKKLALLVSWVGISCFFSGAGISAEEPAIDAKATLLNYIVAVVNSEVITAVELETQMKAMKRQLSQQKVIAPPDSILRKQLLEQQIMTRLQLQLAKETGIRVDDDQLNSTISNIASQNNLSLAEFRDVLEKDGFEFEKFREDIRNEIIITRLRQRQIDSRVNVTEQEVNDYLAHSKAQGNSKSEYHLGHILVATSEAASPEEVKEASLRAEKILKKLKDGANFKEVAMAESDGQRALEGGDLGWRKGGQLPTLFSEIVIKMKKGEISPVVRSPSGFHIIKLLDQRNEQQHLVTQTKARHILIRVDGIETEESALKRLNELRERILFGDDFAELARSNSDDKGSAAHGGELGWTSPGEMVPLFEKAMNSLKPGEVSEPFKTRFGWHIVQVLDRRAHNDTEEFKRSQARRLLQQRKAEEEYQTWLRRLRDEAYVELR
ncbi:MAG TPA: molecular chaperone SurA [Gammaproteobacteria bacterium]|nr:molecular chaperone SurA [Gammaproteobacteria bacterium]